MRHPKYPHWINVKLIALILMGVFLASCQTSRKALDLETIATLDIYTERDVNPDADNLSLIHI